MYVYAEVRQLLTDNGRTPEEKVYLFCVCYKLFNLLNWAKGPICIHIHNKQIFIRMYTFVYNLPGQLVYFSDKVLYNSVAQLTFKIGGISKR